MKGQNVPDRETTIRPRLYISVMLVMVMIVLLFLQQWDWLLAVLIGFLLGNGLSALFEKR